jgi:hypothetical protein
MGELIMELLQDVMVILGGVIVAYGILAIVTVWLGDK